MMDGESRSSVQPGAAQEHRHARLSPREGQVGGREAGVRQYFYRAQSKSVPSGGLVKRVIDSDSIKAKAAKSNWKSAARIVGVAAVTFVAGLFTGSVIKKWKRSS